MKKLKKDIIIISSIVGGTFYVHDGISFKKLLVNDSIVGYSVGLFCFTKKIFKKNGKKK